MSPQLTPETVEAPGRSRRFLPFGFGPRFLLLFVIGFVWLIPAWWAPQLTPLMFIWDGLLIIVWVYDLLRLPKPASMAVSRSFSGPLTLGNEAMVTLSLRTDVVSLTVIQQDEVPATLSDGPTPVSGLVGSYQVIPRERGATKFGRVFLRYRSALAFAERWGFADLPQEVLVYPDLLEAKDQALYLIRSRQQQVEKRHQRHRGMGREFEALREYRQGDELRDVCWTATARRHSLVTRTYTIERSQAVWVVIDAGRLMRAHIQSDGVRMSKLDYAVNAGLAVAQVVEQSGDRVGLLAYGRGIEASIAPGRGRHHLRLFMEALAKLRPEALEADHGRAAANLLHKQTRRALIVWITDFAETPALPDVIEYASHVARRHLVLFTALSQPDLARVAHAVPSSEREMYRHAAALEIVDRRELLLRQMRQSGILAMDLPAAQFTISLVNQYIAIKDRSLL